ncbi:MAG TPA: hypothetical protein VHZ24_17030 [Pirellulales bacterium]|jgi:hypothetical protein|nr:hypothetical protein [Pirellulales bacterium]
MRSVCIVVMLAAIAPAARADVAADRATLEQAYATKLDELARWCDEQKLSDQAARVRAWIMSADAFTLSVAVMRAVTEPPLPADASAAQREFSERFAALRRAQADALFALAQEAGKQHRLSLAYELVAAAARENSDHADARRILGYQMREGRWLTTYEIDKAHGNQVWHERWGWLLRDRAARYERGERFYRGTWMSVAEEARRVGDVNTGWEVVTEHYSVRTNQSLEEGVRLATRLERLYRTWRQVFILYHATEADVTAWLRGGTPKPPTPQRHKVVYFRTRDEYVAALVGKQPQIGVSTGYYDPDARTAYFFAGQQDDTTLYHEATHQLFAEVRSRRGPFGDSHNFWVVEGIACYMETLADRGSYCLLGGTEAPRLLAARYRTLKENFFVPLAELTAMDRVRFQGDPRLVKLYSEAAAMSHFLMHAEAGRYRDALDDYLFAVYMGRDRVNTLSELTGASYEQLDAAYRRFLESLPVESEPTSK